MDEPPPPPILVRSQGRGFNGRDALFEPESVPLNRPFPGLSLASAEEFAGRMRRGPSQPVEGDDWIREFTSNASPVTPRSSGTWSVSTELNDWMDNVPWNIRSDVFWNGMTKIPPEFYPTSPDIDEIITEIDKTIETNTFYLERYELPYPYLPDYDRVPTAPTLNIALVEKYINNFRTTKLKLKPDERYLFLIMVRNYLKYAPPEIIDSFIYYFRKRGGTRKKRKRKHKTKRV